MFLVHSFPGLTPRATRPRPFGAFMAFSADRSRPPTGDRSRPAWLTAGLLSPNRSRAEGSGVPPDAPRADRRGQSHAGPAAHLDPGGRGSGGRDGSRRGIQPEVAGARGV